MPLFVPIKSVVRPTHLEAFVFRNRTSNDRVKMEVYAGWVTFTFDGDDDPPIDRDTLVTFLPVAPNTVRTFRDQSDLIDVTVTAAVSAAADYDDEANVEAVDFATVRLEPQVFGGVSGQPLCLVLRVRLAALAAKLHGVAYQVTVLTGGREDGDLLELDGDERPR